MPFINTIQFCDNDELDDLEIMSRSHFNDILLQNDAILPLKFKHEPLG